MAPASSSSSTSSRTSSVIPNLDNAPLNFKSLREQSVKDIIKLLDNIRGRKCLVLDPTLSGSLTLLLPTTLLKEHDVEQFIRLSPHRKLPGSAHSSPSDAIQGDVSKVIYLIRSQLDLARLVSSHIHHDLTHGLPRDYFVFFVPRRTIVCDKASLFFECLQFVLIFSCCLSATYPVPIYIILVGMQCIVYMFNYMC